MAEVNYSNSLSKNLATLIVKRLSAEKLKLKAMWDGATPFHHFYIDDLLPEEEVRKIVPNLPPRDSLLLRSSLRERKRVGINFEGYHPILQSSLYAFQEPEVVRLVEEITGLKQLKADPSLYASGISLMAKGDFLNPHLDNSHDGDQKLYRVLNLLFYVSPEWTQENGGNFELWDSNVHVAKEIVAAFNRLVVMETDNRSWHSVNKVKADDLRCCVSNYYFSPVSPTGIDYRHVTTFTGRPEQKVRRAVLAADGMILNAVAKTFPSLLTRTAHRVKAETKVD